MDPDQQYRALVESLRLVAAPPELQSSLLPDFVSITDEISTTFGDAYLLVPTLVRSGKISPTAEVAIQALDSLFSDMPTDGSIAPGESLWTHAFWKLAREHALIALMRLGEEPRPPDLGHIYWFG